MAEISQTRHVFRSKVIQMIGGLMCQGSGVSPASGAVIRFSCSGLAFSKIFECVTFVTFTFFSLCCVIELWYFVPKNGFPKIAARNTSGIGTTAN